MLVLLHSDFNLDVLKRQIDTSLMRGANVIELQPLSELHVTQRLVHNVVSKSDFIPYTKEQDMIANIAKKDDRFSGSYRGGVSSPGRVYREGV